MSSTLRVGLFVAGSLLLFGLGIFWIGRHNFRFKSTYRLNADFANVAGLDIGAAVRVGGMPEGTVRTIELPQRPDQKIRVEMDLSDSTTRVVKQDSVAAIRTEGMIGDQYVEISFGSVDAPAVKNGDTIASEPPLEISDMMKKASAILNGAQDAVENVDQITAKFNQGKGTVGALINDRGLYQHINAAAANLQDDTEALKHNFLLRGFFKHRGYEDDSELKQHAIAQMPSQDPNRQFEYPGKKLFDKDDSAKIKDAKMLDDAGHFLESGQHGPVVIAAFADDKGDSAAQRKASEARAAVVREYLVKHYRINDKQVTTIGLGKSQGAPDGGEVAILVYPPGTKVPPTIGKAQ